jgi:hypothetical protein
MKKQKKNKYGYRGVIGIDLDGTICPELAYPNIAPPWQESIEALQYAREMGFYLLLTSTRTSVDLSKTKKKVKEQYKKMIAYVKKYKLPIDEIDDGTRGKVYYDIMADNKGWLMDKGGRLEKVHIDEIIHAIHLGLITVVTYDKDGNEQYMPKEIK